MILNGMTEASSLLLILLSLIIFQIAPVRLYNHGIRKLTGCHYNGTWYADKSMVLTKEKCLNCQCSENTLVCRLKVCPEMPIPPPRGCVLVQKKSTCCPYLSCTSFDNSYKIPITRRIIAYLDQYERESIDRVINENILQGRSDDNEIDLYVCVKNGTVYKSGSAMSSSNLCSYCYCIGGTEKCVRPKCMLPVNGCKPIFVDSTCCPVRYDCSSKSTGKSSHEMRYRKTSNKHYLRISQRYQRNRGCTVNEIYYPEGYKMKSDPDKPCTICFCIRGQRKCAPKKCAPALRNCIPVIPKGQCCPSSYDCGHYSRASNSRQFNLLSLLFGQDDGENSNNTQMAVEYPPDRMPLGLKEGTTTQRSIFDAIREGLEFIDNNTQHLEKEINIMPLQSTLKSSLTNDHQAPSSSTEAPALPNTPDFNTTRTNASSADNSTKSVSSNSNATTVNSLMNRKEDAETKSPIKFEPNLNNTESKNDFDSSDATDSYFSTTQIDGVTDKSDNFTETSDFTTITTEGTYTTEFSTTENLLGTTLESTVTNDLDITQRSDLFSSTTEKMNQSLNLTTLSPDNPDNPDNQNETIPVLSSIKNESIIQSIKPEKKADFLDVLLNGLSDIFAGEKLTSNATIPVTTERISNENSSRLPYITFSTKPMPAFKPLPTEKTPGRINSKITNLTFQHPTTTVTKGLENANTNSAIVVLPEAQEFPFISSTTMKALNASDPMQSFAFDVMSAPIKMNPSILDSESFEDAYKPTLPPSLPNLKIIPFLPTDAVKGDHHKLSAYKFYHQNPGIVNPRIDYSLYDDTNVYPSITEKYPSYNNLEDESKAEYIYKFNVEGPDALITDFQMNGDKPSKGFSPPTKTEGGFIPKDPLILDNDATPTDNLDTIQPNPNDNPNYHLKSHIIDIATAAFAINNTTTKIIEITTPDPFKNVIKTEPPPNLTLLIEDKNKNKNLLLPPALAVTAEKSYIIPSVIEVNLTSTQPDKKHVLPDNLETQIGLVINVQPTPIQVNATTFKIQDTGTSYAASVPGSRYNTTMDGESGKSKVNEFNTGIQNAGMMLQEALMNNTDNRTNIKKQTTVPTLASVVSVQPTKRHTYKTNANKMTRVTPKIKAASKTNKNKSTTPTVPMMSTASVPTIGTATVTVRPVFNGTRRITNSKPLKNHRNRTTPSIKRPTSPALSSASVAKTSTTIRSTNFQPNKILNTELSSTFRLSEQAPSRNISGAAESGLKFAQLNDSSRTDNRNNVSKVSNPEETINKNLKASHNATMPRPVTAPPTTQRTPQHYTSSHNLIDPAGILKLAGCNIYGRMYRVGRIIIELSNPCLECRCTDIGVKCNPLDC